MISVLATSNNDLSSKLRINQCFLLCPVWSLFRCFICWRFFENSFLCRCFKISGTVLSPPGCLRVFQLDLTCSSLAARARLDREPNWCCPDAAPTTVFSRNKEKKIVNGEKYEMKATKCEMKYKKRKRQHKNANRETNKPTFLDCVDCFGPLNFACTITQPKNYVQHTNIFSYGFLLTITFITKHKIIHE